VWRGTSPVMARREWRFEPRAEQLPHARAVLRKWLDARGIPQSVTTDALLIASELVTNGVVHDGAGLITMRAEATEDNLRLEVVTTDALAEKAVQAIITAAQTGSIGDGKIFLSKIDDAIRIRNEDRGDLAL